MAYQVKDAEGNPTKHNDQEVFGSDVVGVVKGVDLDKRTLSMIASTEDTDRDGDIIRVKGWDLENYLKNPVMLWGHDYSSVPIAAAFKVIKRRSPVPQLAMSFRFPTKDLYPFADMILELYKEKILNASSVGFMPTQWNKIDEEDDSFFAPREFVKQELLELSGVSVPSNPNAIQNAMDMSKQFNKGDQMVSYLFGQEKSIPIIGENDIKEWKDELDSVKADYEEEEAPVHQVPKDYNVDEHDSSNDLGLEFVEDDGDDAKIVKMLSEITERLERLESKQLDKDELVTLVKQDLLANTQKTHDLFKEILGDNNKKVVKTRQPQNQQATLLAIGKQVNKLNQMFKTFKGV